MKYEDFDVNDWHYGRSFPPDTHIEAACPCIKEPCGLVNIFKADPTCIEHHPRGMKTMRQYHHGSECVPREPVSKPLHPDFADDDAPLGEIGAALEYHPTSFNVDDIEEVLHYCLDSSYGGKWTPENAENWDGAEPSISALLRLKDGRWAGISGGADYTGWDCQSSAEYWFADSYEDLLSLTGNSLLMAFGIEPRPDLPGVYR